MSIDGEVCWSCERGKVMWRGVTPVSMLRVYLTDSGQWRDSGGNGESDCLFRA